MLVSICVLVMALLFILLSLNLTDYMPLSILSMCLGLALVYVGFVLMGEERRR